MRFANSCTLVTQALQAALDRIDEEELLPYYAPG